MVGFSKLNTEKGCLHTLFAVPGGCDFDVDICNWKNESKIDDFDWTRRKGKTPSSKTGPWKDRRGEGTRAWGFMGKRGGSINHSSAKKPKQKASRSMP